MSDADDDLVIPAAELGLEATGRAIVAEAARAVAEVRQDGETVASLCHPAVAFLLSRGDSELERLLLTLRGIRGFAGLVDYLRKSLRRMSREARAQLRVVGEGETVSVREAIDAPDDWPDYPVPSGWQASPTGIEKLEQQGDAVFPVAVASDPIVVTGVRVDVGTGHESLVLGWRRHGAWRRLAVPREQARDARALVALAGQGIPVSSVTSRSLVSWVDACEAAAGDALPRTTCTTRTGWHDNHYIAGPGGPIELEDPDDLRTGWQPAGTWAGWLDALDVVDSEPAPWLVLYAACVAPLLRWLGLGHNPIVDLSGPRGRGKTTCLRLAGSAWGRPDDGSGGTILTWDASPTHVERTAARTWDAPLLLDDTKRARRPQDVTAALYALAQGRGRGRGTIGGVQRTSTWRTVAISTGEAPLVEATEAGGARARVLSITVSPAISSLEVAKRLEAGILVHHGHLGPRVAARALELGVTLRGRYQRALASWAGEVAADTRLLSTCAAMEVAHSVTREVGVPEPDVDWREALTAAITESVDAGDQAGRALDLVREELARRGGSYRGQERHDRFGSDLEPTGGYRGIWRDGDAWVGIYPAVLRELLVGAGHDPAPVLTQWAEQGILVCSPGRRSLEVGIRSGEKHRVIAFRRAAVLG